MRVQGSPIKIRRIGYRKSPSAKPPRTEERREKEKSLILERALNNVSPTAANTVLVFFVHDVAFREVMSDPGQANRKITLLDEKRVGTPRPHGPSNCKIG